MMLETDFSLIQLIALSAIQGITEFLPISSSGHLVLFPALTGYADQGQLIDVAAHFGTLGAVLIYVRAEVVRMIRGVFSLGKADQEGLALAMMVIMASLPVIAVGLIVELWDPAFLRFALTVALANIMFAGLLYQADTTYPETKTMGAMTMRDAVFIGASQIFALIPGTSRSGITMTAARAKGYSRTDSARFSMLLSLPVIGGASLLKSRHFLTADSAHLGTAQMADAALVAGLSLLTALIAIRFMMGWLAKADFKLFVYYRLALGALLLGAISFGIL